MYTYTLQGLIECSWVLNFCLGFAEIRLIVIAHNTRDRLNVAPAPIWEGWGRRNGWSGSQAGIHSSIQQLLWLTDEDKGNVQSYEFSGECCNFPAYLELNYLILLKALCFNNHTPE